MLAECGVDYLTVTAKHGTPEAGILMSVFEAIKFDDVTHGCDEKPAQQLGYKGSKIATMFHGSNADGSMLRISGGLANVAANMLSWMGGSHNVTRLDVQGTVIFAKDRLTRAQETADAVRIWQAASGLSNPPSVRLISSFGKGDTCTIGARSSEVFIRIYDKSREQKVDGPPWLWRYEVELKGERALQAMRLLGNPGSVEKPHFAILDYYMRSRGVEVPWDVHTDYVPDPIERPTTDVEKKLSWLENQVKSSVQYLCFKGHRQLVIEALGLDEFE